MTDVFILSIRKSLSFTSGLKDFVWCVRLSNKEVFINSIFLFPFPVIGGFLTTDVYVYTHVRMCVSEYFISFLYQY